MRFSLEEQRFPMDLMEYQGKQYFARFGIPVSAGGVADTVEEAVAHAERIGYPVVVKAQVMIGGRGKAGGIKLANTADEVRFHAGNILGLDIRGHIVRRLWIERASEIAQSPDRLNEKGEPKAEEYYASFALDRSAKKYLGMLSAEGGVEIESVADELIAKIHVDPILGLSEEACRAWIAAANLPTPAREGAVGVLMALYRCYTEGDCELAEINPLILTTDGRVHALDAKVTLDDAAHDRHPEWADFEAATVAAGDSREALAKEKGLQYVGLEGSVGIIANGAGLAMSTVDIVKQVGGAPANFLDIGGGANAEVMVNALTVISTDPNVRAIFINIFGGITRCDEVARGIVEALSRITLSAPIVARIDGTNAAEGRAILKANESEKLIMLPDMLSAAQKAVEIAGK
jgi:succinyl-CoA synthetase beta subunit